jgi:hypothetical protein
MALIYDNPDLAALTLTRLAAEESEEPGALKGRMLDYLDGLEQRNGTPSSSWWPSPSPGSTSNPWTTWPGQPETIRQHCWTPPK